MRNRLRMLFFVSILGTTTFAASDPMTAYEHMYFKESHRLELKPDTIAVFHSARLKTSEIISLLVDVGISECDVHRTVTAGISRVSLSQPIADMRTTLAKLSTKTPPGTFISPVFKDTLGGDLIPTQEILIGFDGSHPEADNIDRKSVV